ncbi:hypothetical protein PRIPAC_88314 [Pristionchus pacificus]|uniref:Uncharacterized protein n=1 Tax=Pristionchus pacificus TaxID=54126 RepID=A0A2A6B8Y1_PRIPA|nr:hypothetical protein PRIPAC_88314 [Pristionchus pacificus]|eukprot:PDM62342.1 hypothetical protein PRIPAC_51784 [Pristionchus pacificus]
MSPCQNMNLNLASLPTDIIRIIIPGINDPIQLNDSRLISHRWHVLVEEHFNQSNRKFYPKIYNFRRSICTSGGITFRMRILQKYTNYFGVASWQIKNIILIDAISKDADIKECHFDKLSRMFTRCSRIEHLCLDANYTNEDVEIVEKSLNDVSIGFLKVNVTRSNGVFVCQASRFVKIIELSLELDKASDKLNQSGQVTATFHSDPLRNGRTLLSIFVKSNAGNP